MGAYDTFQVDVDLETKTGVVLDHGDYRITILRAGGNNKAFQKTLEAVSRPYMRAIQTETMDNTKAEDLLREAYAATVIINWEVKDEDDEWTPGIGSPDGDDVLDFTKDNVLMILRDKRLQDLWVDIRNCGQKAALFRASILEAQAGN